MDDDTFKWIILMKKKSILTEFQEETFLTQGGERNRKGLEAVVKDSASLEIVRAGETRLQVAAAAKLMAFRTAS